MALNWSFKDKVGTLEFTQFKLGEDRDFSVNLYQGNALLIFIYEWKEDDDEGDAFHYNLYDFFADKKHMENSLGLSKGYDFNIRDNWKKFTFFKDKISNKDLATIVSALVKAFPNITIEIKETEGGK